MSKKTTYQWLVDHSGYSDSKCLIFPFSKNWDGYGRTSFKGKDYNAHRLMCIIAHGEPPTTKHHAAHKCGVTSCVNPNHLYWATPSQNQRDNVRRGKSRSHVLSGGKRRFAEFLLQDGVSQLRVAQILGVSPRTIRFLSSPKRAA